MNSPSQHLGVSLTKHSAIFNVWAPNLRCLQVEIENKGIHPLNKNEKGYFQGEINGICAGDRYWYRLENGKKLPDPVSKYLPLGVHGPTEIISENFEWQEGSWKGIAWPQMVFYELHIGTFTPEGTFESALKHVDSLLELGITCIEVMPIAQFPGRWNWGYDGVSLYAPFTGYGGPFGFYHFVNICHQKGMAVCLDVVYNHLGPEGNYLSEFGPYFSATYKTPWGEAFNYDGPHSDEVRSYIIQNALYWMETFHVDALRLDAIHGIYDRNATPMLQELCLAVEGLSKKLNKPLYVIAESDLHDVRVIKKAQEGGLHFTALWNDDFHHAVHVALTKEKHEYYQDFMGLQDFSKSLLGPVYEGQYSPFRQQRHGNSFQGISWDKYLIFLQNHDQIGNRPFGNRMTTLVSKETLKVAIVLHLLSPAIPLIFMGEEYGEKAPFEYFVDFSDKKLMEAIVEGRKKEFGQEKMPHPGKESFLHSCLTWKKDQEVVELYQTLLRIRKANLPQVGLTREELKIYLSEEEEWVALEYPTEKGDWIGLLCSFGKKEVQIKPPFCHLRGELIFTTQQFLEKGNSWRSLGPSALVLK